jgi:hypothetical protein
VIVYLIYSFVGIFGYIGIFGKKDNDAHTIMDYYPADDFSVFFVAFLFSLFLLCILPFLVMLSKN